MPRRKMTDAEYDECKRIATEIKDTIYAGIGKTTEEGYLNLFLALSPAEREEKLDFLIILSGRDNITFKALDLIVMKLREREERIPDRLMYWYIDSKSKRVTEPKPKAGTKHQNRDFAVAKCMHKLNDLGMKMVRKKDFPPISAADAVAEVFQLSFATVSQIWDDCKNPDSERYKIFPSSFRRC